MDELEFQLETLKRQVGELHQKTIEIIEGDQEPWLKGTILIVWSISVNSTLRKIQALVLAHAESMKDDSGGGDLMSEEEIQRMEDAAQVIDRAVENFGHYANQIEQAAQKMSSAANKMESAGGMMSMAAGRMQG